MSKINWEEWKDEDEKWYDKVWFEITLPFHRFWNTWGWKIFTPRAFKWWWQRRTRGFDNRELWDLWYPLAEHIAPRLRAFAESPGCSYPSGIMAESHGIDDEDSKNVKLWHNMVEKMARAFELMLLDGNDLDYSDIKITPGEKTACGRKMNIEKDDDMDAERNRIMNEREEEIQEGLELFIKYFRDLWD